MLCFVVSVAKISVYLQIKCIFYVKSSKKQSEQLLLIILFSIDGKKNGCKVTYPTPPFGLPSP